MNRIFWDLECGRTKRDDESWDQYKAGCGISVACVLQDQIPHPWFYTPGDKKPYDLYSLVERLEQADEVVSFNGERFDNTVLISTLGLPALRLYKSVDLFRCILDAKGWARYPEGSWKLDSICRRTLAEGKDLNDGAFAPQKAKDGRWGELFSYSYRDVDLTRRLYEFIAAYGYVIDPVGRRMEVRLDGA